MVDLSTWDENKLLNNVWIADQCGQAPTGGLPLSDYLMELVRRDPNIKLYHSYLTANERLDKLTTKEQ